MILCICASTEFLSKLRSYLNSDLCKKAANPTFTIEHQTAAQEKILGYVEKLLEINAARDTPISKESLRAKLDSILF